MYTLLVEEATGTCRRRSASRGQAQFPLRRSRHSTVDPLTFLGGGVRARHRVKHGTAMGAEWHRGGSPIRNTWRITTRVRRTLTHAHPLGCRLPSAIRGHATWPYTPT